jgi:hypothetical protein
MNMLDACSRGNSPDAARRAQCGITQRTAQPTEHRRAAQKPLHLFWQPGQALPVEIVGHIPVVTGDRPQAIRAVFGNHGRQVQPGLPTLGAPGDHRCQLRGQAYVLSREDRLGASGVESQISGHDFNLFARCPEPGQMRLLESTGGHELRTPG